jgi:hypothetical protein
MLSLIWQANKIDWKILGRILYMIASTSPVSPRHVQPLHQEVNIEEKLDSFVRLDDLTTFIKALPTDGKQKVIDIYKKAPEKLATWNFNPTYFNELVESFGTMSGSVMEIVNDNKALFEPKDDSSQLERKSDMSSASKDSRAIENYNGKTELAKRYLIPAGVSSEVISALTGLTEQDLAKI